MHNQIANLNEIRAILNHFPDVDQKSIDLTKSREISLTKPAGSLGILEEITAWLAGWQAKYPAKLEHPRIAVFAGNHGVAAQNVSAFPSDVTKQMVKNFIQGGAAINQLCKLADADLKVYEMNLDQPTEDFTIASAMSEEECTKAFAFGMTAVEPGIDILGLGEMGIGNTTSAAALCYLLFGGEPEDWVGYGTGISHETLHHKINIVKKSAQLHQNKQHDGFEIMRRVGGLELAAIAGAIIAARLARVPVILDGFATTAAASILFHCKQNALDHCYVSHVSAEPGHKKLLDIIKKKALLNFNMRLGEASGAALVIPIFKAALSCHQNMATFDSAHISNKVR
ncbi:MAG: nicotinate-nucleotide--dimethylbenzimidazole phosphoribosyltransferase [Alphaproteobacteria bacterium]|nr:nicotinate-nucleotide--dimethylbenzimidazole phosphoribosyltransferase [Alphaproteobacteria bacterium]